MTHWSPDRFAGAWSYAARLHQGQSYGGPGEGERVDYLEHVGRVAAEVMWAAEDTDDAELAVLCAVLHDTLEDTPATYGELAARFGAHVADGVQALTKDAALPADARMADSLERIRRQPRAVWMVKLADRIANLTHPPFYWDRAKIEAYRREAMAIHEALHPASPLLAGRLREKIERYQAFQKPHTEGTEGN